MLHRSLLTALVLAACGSAFAADEPRVRLDIPFDGTVEPAFSVNMTAQSGRKSKCHHLKNAAERIFGFDCRFEGCIARRPFHQFTFSNKTHEIVVNMWSHFEADLSDKITRMLHDSRSMRQVKIELWQRQEASEAILLETESKCDDDILHNQFLTDMESKLPAFRREMGKKIAASPKMAEKIYDVLDSLSGIGE